jgi:phosphoesterase RecJ-like protein
MEPISQIIPQLTLPKKVVITMHQKPDGDAMGSVLALSHFLIQFGHQVNVISPTNWATFLNWMPACKSVIDYEKDSKKSDTIINDAEWIFCLDFNTLSRTKKMEQSLLNATAVKILIDHHQQPQKEVFSFGISDTSKSSTAEMVYDFILSTGFQDKINDEVCQCLYTGVMTDTGSFRFPSTSPNVHLMIADLLKRGLNHSVIHENLFDNFSENRLRFIGNTLLNRMQVFYEYNTALIAIPSQI